MSRKKTKKLPVKRQTTNNSVVTVQKMEKDFLEAPVKIAAQLNKEIASLEQSATKLKNAVNKIKTQIITSQKRVKLAGKVKTAAGKKLLISAKKTLADTLKTQTMLIKQLQETIKSLDVTSKKQAKIIALRKAMSQFEKEWTKKSKTLKAKKIKTKTKPKKQRASVKTLSSAPLTEHHSTTNDFNNIADDVRHNETTEIA